MADAVWNFQGRTALVTGGTRGIGRAVVDKLVDAGADVIFTFADSAVEAEAMMRRSAEAGGPRLTAIRADFTQTVELERALAQITASGVLHHVVNNAGMLIDKPLYRMEPDEWNNVLQVNLSALYYIAKKCTIPLAAAGGSMVNVSSVAGIAGEAGQVNYCSAKAGVIGFTKAYAREVGRLGIRVNAVAPGYIDTDMAAAAIARKRGGFGRQIPLARAGSAEEIADVILFLLSDASSYVHGEVLKVDGGML